MKNQTKRILSIALALVLMVSIVAIPASAAEYDYSSEMMHVATTLTGNSAIKTDGSIWGWGNGYSISHHVTTHQDTPIKGRNPHGFVSIGGAGEGEAWGITAGGDLWLWNRYDEIFEKQMGDVASFAYYWGKSYELCLAIKTDGTLVGWGWGSEFGDMLPGVAANTDPTITAEDAIVLATDVKQVEAGDRFWAMLKKDGTFWTCGYNLRGFLTASPSAGEEIIPLTKVMDNVSAFACGPITANTMLVIKQDGSLWSWELRDATPKRILEDVVFAKTSGSTHFAITKDGTLYGWGDNDYSQAGGGSASSTTPVAVANNAVSVSVNGMSAVMLKSDGTAWSCGLNNLGQCGVPKGGSSPDSNVTEWTKFLDGVALPGSVTSGTTSTPTPTPTAGEKVAQSMRPVTIFTDEQGRINRFYEDGARIPHTENGEIVSVYDDRVISVTTFSYDYKPIKTHTFDIELTYIAGLLVGEDYYFLVFYDYNLEEKDNVEVMRIVKYSRDWVRIGAASIYGGEIGSYGMGYGGNFSYAERNGMLYIHTAQSMFKSSDGQNHQANLTMSIRISDMKLTDSNHKVANNNTGYVSHSKAQDIMIDSQSNIITLDNGDGYPNGAYLFRYNLEAGADKFVGGIGDGAIIKTWATGHGAWYTNSETQALVETSQGYLSAYIDSGMGSNYDYAKHPMNAYLALTPRDSFDAASTKTYAVTSFPKGTSESVYFMKLVPVNMDGGYVIVVTRDTSATGMGANPDYKMYWAKYSADGSVTALTKFDTDAISWGDILYIDNQLVWLEYANTSRQNLYIPEELISNFYTFDGTTLTYHPQNTVDSTEFSDVPSTHWSYEYVKKAASNNLVQGVGDGKYEPERNVSNAEWATMAVNLFYKNDTGRSGDYWWSANMDIAGSQRNILAGTTVAANGTSSWNAGSVQSGINRYDMAQVIYNIAKEQGWTIPDTSSTSSKIADWSSIPTNYREAVAYCFSAGFVTGVDSNGTFNGASTMTRAQAATVLCRLLDAKNAHN